MSDKLLLDQLVQQRYGYWMDRCKELESKLSAALKVVEVAEILNAVLHKDGYILGCDDRCPLDRALKNFRRAYPKEKENV